MADDSGLVLESSQPTKDENGDSQGNSTAKSKGVRPIPNYLRASSGSCHDACKYGTSHEFVKKPRPPMRRRKSNAEIPVEIYTPDKKRIVNDAKATEPDDASLPCLSTSPYLDASPSHDVLMASKQKSLDPRKSPPSVTSKSVRQGVTEQMKVPSPSTFKSVNRQGVTSHMKPSSPSTSKSVRQGVTSQTKVLSSSTSNSAKKQLSLHLKSSESSSFESNKQGPSLGTRSGPLTVKQPLASSSTRSGPSTVKQPLASSSFRSPVAKTSNMINQKASTPRRIKSFSPGLSDSIKPSEGKSMRYSSGESSTSTSSSLKSKSSTQQVPSANPTAQTSCTGVTGARNGGGKTSSPSIPRTVTKKVMAPTVSRLSPRDKIISQLPVKRASIASSISGDKSASASVRKKMVQSDGSQESEGSSKDQISTGHSDAKELDDEKTPEKTLHVIKVETDCQTTISAEDVAQIMQSQLVLSPGSLNSISHSNSPSFSANDAAEPNTDSDYTYGSESDGSVSDYDDDDDDDDGGGGAEGNGSEIIDGEQNGKTRNTRKMLSSEGNQSGPTKLKFRRGKIVDPEANALPPRRLRFRRRRVLTNDQGSSGGSHRRRKANVGHTGNAENSDATGEKVVLRHQDAQAKKNEQGLFNNVIEETASKLAETRKSKVKALVGAFETVILLQERKPPSGGDKTPPHSSPVR